MFKNMKLGVKISFGFAAVITIAILLGSLAIYNMLNVKGESTKLAVEYIPMVEDANNIQGNTLQALLEIRGYLYTVDETFLTSGLKSLDESKKAIVETKELINKSSSLANLRSSADKMDADMNQYDQLLQQTLDKIKKREEIRARQDEVARLYLKANSAMMTSLKDPRQILLANEINELINAVRVANWKSQAKQSRKILEDVMPNYQLIENKLADLRAVSHGATSAINEFGNAIMAYKQPQDELIANWKEIDELNKTRGVAVNEIIAGSKNMASEGMQETRRISNAAATALSTSSTATIIGLFVALVIGVVLATFITLGITRPVGRIISGLTEGAEQVGAASEQVAGASQSLAEGASEQASSLEETSSSLEEMSSMTKQNAENAKQANILAAEATAAADKGAASMEGMSRAIQEIKKSSDETAKIIKVIDEIAFQTNLLALNAAVEAARAGEAGKGFAVVAEEVRNLAQRSAEAAKNTSSLIEGAQKNADNGVHATQEAMAILNEVTTAIKKVNDLVGEVTAASEEQSQGIGQVNVAVAQMDQVTQQTASNAEESSSASEELAAQAQQMQEIVGQLSLLVGSKTMSNIMDQPQTIHGKNGKSLSFKKSSMGAGLKDKIHAMANRQTSKKAMSPVSNASIRKGADRAEEIIPLGNDDEVNF
jgi:methyl-accepting chemotaxis protein